MGAGASIVWRRTQPMRVPAFRLGDNQDTLPSDRGRSAAQTGNVGSREELRRILPRFLRHSALIGFAAHTVVVCELFSGQARNTTDGDRAQVPRGTPMRTRLSHSIRQDMNLGNLSFSADGRYLAIATERKIQVRDADTFDIVHEIEEENVHERRCSFSPDSRLLVYSTGKHSSRGISVASVSDWAQSREFLSEGGFGFERFLFSRNGLYMCALCWFSAATFGATIFDVSSRKKISTIKTSRDGYSQAAFIESGMRIALQETYAASLSVVKLYDCKNPAEPIVLSHKKGILSSLKSKMTHKHVADIQASPDGYQILTVGIDEVRLWGALDGRLIAEPKLPDDKYYFAEYSRDGASIFLISKSRKIYVLDARNFSIQETVQISGGPSHGHYQFDPKQRYVVGYNTEKEISVWDWQF